MRLLVGAAAGLMVAASVGAGAAEWRVQEVAGVRGVDRVVSDASGRVFALAGQKWLEVRAGANGVCVTSGGQPKLPAPAPDGALPDGEVAVASGTGIVRAWLSRPTRRYGHGVIGDRIEAGSLVAFDGEGRRHEFVLPETHVFEDRYPRLVDIDRDGGAEAVVVRSSISTGAAVAVYGLQDGKLVQVAQTSDIGLSNRWLNPVGIADFTGDGRIDIALVRTPHIGGLLEIWTYLDGELLIIGQKEGFSNHWIGSRELRVSVVSDLNGDGRPDIALPSASRNAVRLISVAAGLREIARIELPDRVGSALAVLRTRAGAPVIVFATDRGRLMALHAVADLPASTPKHCG